MAGRSLRRTIPTAACGAALAAALLTSPLPRAAESSSATDRWSHAARAAIERAGDNRGELNTLLRDVPAEHRDAALFLLANMPDRDLKTLTARFLLDEIILSHETLAEAPWAARIPRDVFLNEILPYANVGERRDAWRKDLRDRCRPLIAGATTPGQAAVLLNQKLFPLVGVRYSTKRARPDQSPAESIGSGTATCTGLSILLIDACRAVGVPARFVGTPCWSDGSGNHSWVEVWDDGWHFTGAAEPAGDKLDEAWFTGRAATARRDAPRHAIYAVSFRRTPLRFPVAWNPLEADVWGVNVTDAYARADARPPEGTSMVSFCVVDPATGARVEAGVRVRDPDGAVVLDGVTKDERFDTNDHLHAHLERGTTYRVDVSAGARSWTENVEVGTAPRLVSWDLPGPADAIQVGPTGTGDSDAAILRALARYLETSVDQREAIESRPFANDGLSKAGALAAEKLLVADHRATTKAARRAEMDARVIEIDGLTMPFAYRVFGEKPAGGRSLFISMHGGGGAPPQVNDGQWRNQQRLYEPAEGVYVAPRAPTDTWDLWHQSHIDRMFDRLIEDMVLFEDVDPDRVYLLGYSAGGDGVYQLAPRMADRFAAASMMAGHPNETSPLGLRNLPFAIHMGDRDTAFNRIGVAREWKEKLEALRTDDPEGYVHVVKLHEDKGHWMDLQDAEALPWMQQFTRHRHPRRVVWKQDDVVEARFYWLGVDPVGLPERALVVADVDGQTIRIHDCDPSRLILHLRDDLVDMSREITVVRGDELLARATVPRTIATIAATLRDRGDPASVYWGRLEVAVPKVGRE